jgi:hypothetical protein
VVGLAVKEANFAGGNRSVRAFLAQ